MKEGSRKIRIIHSRQKFASKIRKRERNIVRSTLADSRTAFEKGKKISYLVGKLATGIMEPLGSRGGTGCPLIRSTIEDSIRRYWGGRWGEGARKRIERERAGIGEFGHGLSITNPRPEFRPINLRERHAHPCSLHPSFSDQPCIRLSLECP